MNLPQTIFQFTSLEREVILKEGTSQITINGNTYSGRATAYIQLSLQPAIRFKAHFDSLDSKDSIEIINNNLLSFSFDGKDIPGFISSSNVKLFEQNIDLIWQPRSEEYLEFGNNKELLNRIDFHLFNIFNAAPFIGKTIWEGWNISIEGCKPNKKEEVSNTKETGGFLLTHMGKLTRADGKTFTGESGNKILNLLNLAMLFAIGRPVSCICPVGFNNENQVLWQHWNSPPSSWYSVINFLPDHDFNLFHKFLPGFLNLISSNQSCGECIREIIYWYGRANNSKYVGIDASIILTQTAIERLSYEYIVLQKKMLSYDGFKNLKPASEKFRMLFSLLNIPAEIPANLKTIKSINPNWLDSAHALTDIRNSLVHPEHKSRNKYSKAYVEAWHLSLWYLELCLLSLSNYKGEYKNRSKYNNGYLDEEVPWLNTL